jgi:hypothetical protein
MKFIYFIADLTNNEVKIGISKDPHKRLKQLQTARSNKLKLLKTVHGTNEDEKKYHSLFCWYKKEGEWYELSDELWEFIRR